ncbi:MAG TPA: outer membrane lipoprotein carrier protein LolA [Terriglobales bacterium]
MSMKAWHIGTLALTSLLCFSSFTSAEESIGKLAARVDQHYNNLKSLRSDFEEIYQGAGLSRRESGELWLLKPGKMRWDYKEPRPKLFVTDNKSAYFYVPGDRQARRLPVKNLEDFRSPIRFLLGHTKLQKEFDHLAVSTEKPLNLGDVVLQGVPLNMKDRVARVLLEMTPAGQLTRIFIEELDGSITDFRFTNIQEDVPVKSELFKFKAPEGVQVIETNEGAP